MGLPVRFALPGRGSQSRSAPKELTEQSTTQIPPPNPPKSPYNQTWHFEKAPQIQRLKRAAFRSSREGKSQLIEETAFPQPPSRLLIYLGALFFFSSFSSFFFFVVLRANIRKRKCKLIWWGTVAIYDAPQLRRAINPIGARCGWVQTPCYPRGSAGSSWSPPPCPVGRFHHRPLPHSSAPHTGRTEREQEGKEKW